MTEEMRMRMFRIAGLVGEQGKFLRERWTLTPGGLQFDLEASGNGAGPQRVGGFTAIRQ
jgi:hypothetical protein